MDSKKIFEGVKGFNPQYSNFDLSYEYKGTGNFGWLMPVFFKDVMPGDQFSVNTEIMVRFAPLLAPILHRVNVFIHYFEVPWRLIWDDWEDFITGGDDGTAAPTFPEITINSFNYMQIGRLTNYFGMPSTATGGSMGNTFNISKLPFIAYHTIWDQYYRDQNLQTAYDSSAYSDDNTTRIRIRSYEKDYFTSALPDLQKATASAVAVSHTGPTVNYLTQSTFSSATTVGDIKSDGTDLQDSGSNAINLENISSISLSSTVDINDLRLASRLQEWWERRSRGGSRYIEVIESEFGVRSSNKSLNRVRYLGGGKQPVVISEVLQTSEDGTTPLGEMTGHAIAVGEGMGFKEFFEEYGCVMGIMSVLPRTSYMNGIPKFFDKTDRFDFPFPAFAHLGEQAVKNKELFFDVNGHQNDNPESTFGYQQRYAEYKQSNSMAVGQYGDHGDLKYWTLTREFSTEPTLNEDFILCEHDEDGIDRIFATQTSSDHKIWFQLYHQVYARRPLPYFSDPRL